MPQPIRLVIDCDPGIDDAIALHVVAAAARSGQVDLAAIVAGAGNAPLAMTARNAVFLRSRLGLTVPVYRGVDRDPGTDAHDFHGADGIGGCYEAADDAPDPGDGIAWLVEEARRSHRERTPLTLLAVGPLTNVAAALRKEPRLPDLLEHTVIMGGAFTRPGNITPHAEFNFYADAPGAAAVFASRLPVTVIPLDVTEEVLVRPADVDELERHSGPTLATRLLRASIDYYRAADGVDACVMHDALAAAVVLRPEIVNCAPASVRIVANGEGRGRSIADFAAPSPTALVAQHVDVEAARAMLFESLSHAATPA